MSEVTISHVDQVGTTNAPAKEVAYSKAEPVGRDTMINNFLAKTEAKEAEGTTPPEETKTTEETTTKEEAKDEGSTDPKIARRLAELARRQRKDLATKAKWDEEVKSFDQKAAKVNPILSIVERLESDMTEATAIELVTELGKLRGKSAEQFLEGIANALIGNQEAKEEKELTVEELVDKKLEEKEAARKAAADAEEAEKEEAEKIAYAQQEFGKQVKSIEQFAKDREDRYEFVVDEPEFAQTAFDIQSKHFYATAKFDDKGNVTAPGILLSVEAILDSMESELEQAAIKLTQKKKIQAASSAKSESSYETTKGTGPRDTNRAPTLTHRKASESTSKVEVTKTLTRQEQIKAAIEKAKLL